MRPSVRRNLGRVAVVVPAATALLVDVVIRRSTYGAMLRADAVALVVTWGLSFTLWTGATIAATRRRWPTRWASRLLLALLGALTGLQAVAYFYFATTIDFRLLRSAWQLGGMGTLAQPFAGTITRWVASGAVLAVGWTFVAGRIARPKRKTALRAVGATLGALVFAVTTSTFLPRSSEDAAPDVLALGALGRFAIDHPKAPLTATWYAIPDVQFPRTVPPVPHAEPRVRRNVLFILTESVRASAVCTAYAETCEHNPFTNAAVPDRLPLERMRSLDSATLLSFGVMFTGIAVDAPKHDWLTAPLLFDYAHAAGMSTAYLSAQHGDFAGSHAWTDNEPIDRLAWAADFDPHADKMLGADDAAVVDRALVELPTLREPFFAVVHYSGTHFPYWIDNDAPFRPIGAVLDPHDPSKLRNKYFDAIYRQDKLTARLIREVRSMPISKRTVIVFLSDHGESFYDGHRAALHGTSLWDTELRVPAWIDAPKGLLSKDEIASLHDEREFPTTEADVAPTILDLLGLYGVPQWKEFTQHMAGESLLRHPARERTQSIATCNELWPCFVPVTGKLVGERKSVVHGTDPSRCFDTLADPDEQHDLGPGACGQ